MRFIKQAITSYTSPNIVPEYPTWNSVSNYSVGTKVIYGNYIWINASANNTNNEPKTGSVYWAKWGVSNYYSLIDTQSQTQTIVNDDLIVTFDLNDIDSLAIGYFTAESLTIENLDASNNVLRTQTITQSYNEEVFDYYDYIYAQYSISTNRAMYFKIVRSGVKIRVTFTKGILPSVKVGFIVGGSAVDMGKTKDEVKLGWNSFSVREIDDYGILTIEKRADQDIIDFETAIPTRNLMSLRNKAKLYKDEIVAFVVDDTDESIFDNIVTLGVMQEVEPVASNQDITVLTWSILESV